MKVAILGSGAAAFGLAVVLCQNSHDPVLWSPSGNGTSDLAQTARIMSEGAIEGSFPVSVAKSCTHAVKDADAVIIALPAIGHRAVIETLARDLTAGQSVIISAQSSFGALLLDRELAARGLQVPIVAWNTTLLRSRKVGGSTVRIATYRKKVDMAVLPKTLESDGTAVCEALFGDRFNLRSDLLAVTLSNVNAQSHMALCLCNFTRMELGEQWDQNVGKTEAVRRLEAALDDERMALAAAFGRVVRTLDEHRLLTHGSTSAAPIKTLGPATLETRYILEDVPFGLVTLVTLGDLSGTDMPLHKAGINIFETLYGRPLASENDLIPALGLDRLRAEELGAICQAGHAG